MKAKPTARRPTSGLYSQEQMLDALRSAGRVVVGDRSSCPAHDGDGLNLWVGAREDGVAIFRCHSHGCETADIVEALREYVDGDPEVVVSGESPTRVKTQRQRPEAWPAEMFPLGWHQAVAAFVWRKDLHELLATERAILTPVALQYGIWFTEHWKARGEHRFIVPIRDPEGGIIEKIAHAPKSIRAEGRPGVDVDQRATRWALACLDGEVYNPGDLVVVTESEMDALAVRSAGHPAYGCPGSGSWSDDAFAHELATDYGVTRVVVVGDRDAAGEKFNKNVIKSCERVGIEARAVELPASLGDKGDVTDFLLGHAPEDRHAAVLDLIGKSSCEQIYTGELLRQIIDFFRRFIWLPETDDYLALGLWVLVTHAVDAFARYPYLFISSPERECGKTQLLELLEALCARAWKIDGPATEAVIFRKLDQDRPTLLQDELDQLFKLGDQRMAGQLAIWNAGYKRGATVPRCVGDGANMETKDFCVSGPKGFAAINTGAISDTLLSRSIRTALHRLPQGMRVERWRSDREEEHTSRLRELAAEWATANLDALREYRNPPIDDLSPRSEEIWEPMLAVAALAGIEKEAIELAVRLSSVSSPAISPGGALLAKLRDIFGEDRQTISTAEALKALNEDETLSFTGWNDGDGMRPRDLARILGRYGVKPGTVRVKGFSDTCKGYRREDLAPVWETYAPTLSECDVTSVTSPGAGTPSTGKALVHRDVTDVPSHPEGVPGPAMFRL